MTTLTRKSSLGKVIGEPTYGSRNLSIDVLWETTSVNETTSPYNIKGPDRTLELVSTYRIVELLDVEPLNFARPANAPLEDRSLISWVMS